MSKIVIMHSIAILLCVKYYYFYQFFGDLMNIYFAVNNENACFFREN